MIALAVFATALAMTPLQKAEAVVVTSVRPGIFASSAGITFADQEGGAVRAVRDAPPRLAARSYTSAEQAFEAGRATARALRRSGSTSTSRP